MYNLKVSCLSPPPRIFEINIGWKIDRYELNILNSLLEALYIFDKYFSLHCRGGGGGGVKRRAGKGKDKEARGKRREEGPLPSNAFKMPSKFNDPRALLVCVAD